MAEKVSVKSYPQSVAQLFGRYARRRVAPSSIGAATWQTSLSEAVEISGVGLHSGAEVRLRLRPAPADTGIVFLRTDLPNESSADSDGAIIPAMFGKVCQSVLCSMLGNEAGIEIGTVEHIMAAFAGLGVDNAYVEVSGAEVPILDGSAAGFVALIDKAGIRELDTPRTFLRITDSVRVERQGSFCELTPADDCRFDVEIDFPNPVIGRLKTSLTLTPASFREQIADARTFCCLKDVEAMQAAGLALGGTLDNSVVVSDSEVLNKDGLRYEDEFVRHKLLDAVGDIYLLGVPMMGHYRGYKAGHALHNKLLHQLFAEEKFELLRPTPTAQPAQKTSLELDSLAVPAQ